MEKKVNFIFSDEQFKGLNAPMCRSYSLARCMPYPDRLKFNKTYYRVHNSMLQAFRILAIAFREGSIGYGEPIYRTNYLVQEPNMAPRWVEDYIGLKSVIFEHRDDMYAHIQGDTSVNLFHDYKFCDAREHLEGHSFYRDDKIFRLWRMVNGQPKTIDRMVKYFLINEDGIYINLNRWSGDYPSREECMRSYLDGFEVDDFEEDEGESDEVNISFDVRPNTQRVRTIRVVED